MNTALLTDNQLISLYRNRSLDKAIINAVREELNKRQLGPAATVYNPRLPLPYKAGLLLLPMFFPLYLAILGIRECNDEALKIRLVLFLFLPGGTLANYKVNAYLARGESRRWQAYWNWLALGWLLWTVILLGLAALYFKR